MPIPIDPDIIPPLILKKLSLAYDILKYLSIKLIPFSCNLSDALIIPVALILPLTDNLLVILVAVRNPIPILPFKLL